MPDSHGGFATVWAYSFLFFELMAIGYTLFSIIVMLCRSDHRASADAGERRLRAAGQDVPAVDVFIATYNEGLNPGEDHHCRPGHRLPPFHRLGAGRYPARLVARLLRASGVQYARRPDNSHAKAGNLNNGLRQSAASSNAPYILVLDADFAAQNRS